MFSAPGFRVLTSIPIFEVSIVLSILPEKKMGFLYDLSRNWNEVSLRRAGKMEKEFDVSCLSRHW